MTDEYEMSQFGLYAIEFAANIVIGAGMFLIGKYYGEKRTRKKIQ